MIRTFALILVCVGLVLSSGCAGGDNPVESVPGNNAGSNAVPGSLAMAVQPSAGEPGAPLAVQPVLEVRDHDGRVIGGDNTTRVTAAIVPGSGAAGALLLGTATATAVDGEIAYADLAIDRAGTGFRLAFSAPGLAPVTSAPFDVTIQSGALIPPSTPPVSDVYFSIHSRQAVHVISRFIYGINGHDFEDRPAHLTLTRSGGNRLTAYNWETNASNAGTDWYNQNDGYLGGADAPGGAITPAIDDAMAHDAGCIVTVPMLGYVSADKNGGGDVNQTPDYIHTRFHPSYPSKPGAFQLPPDLSDEAVYQDEWVYFLSQRYPAAAGNPLAPLFFSLDNEPDLWAYTHPRLRNDATGAAGTGVTYAELIQKTVAYAKAIKAVEPGAVIFGPVNYGWQGMVDLQGAADSAGRDFLEVYLQAMADAETDNGGRLLDVLDIHWYPEARGGGVRITDDSSQAEVAAARMQAPRSLWDDAYTEDSWIAQWATQGPIDLLPRLQNKIDTFYPGTRMAITEYYYGGGDHISGAIAQADVLGIFGRENLFAATLWKLGGTDHRFIYGGFEMFRDYDGGNGAFGDLSIRAQSSDPAETSVYASTDTGSDDRMVLVCINKTAAAKTAGIGITHSRRFNRVDVYTLTSGSSRPRFQETLNVALTNALQYTMPAYSVSTLVLKP